MNGIININKPTGISSFDVIRKLRKILNTRKIGHTGTLDPLATGVLVVCIGKATKLVSEIEAKSKTYFAGMELGYRTDTYDSEGKILEKSEKTDTDLDRLNEVFSKYIGKTAQIPPMYSAIKVNGQKLYELARKNIEIERKAREIYIDYIKCAYKDKNKIYFETKVSKGTYIRTLIDDIGKDLGTLATMISLERKAVGEYNITESYTLDQIEAMKEKEDMSFLKGVEESFLEFEEIRINTEREFNLFMNGNKQKLEVKTDTKWRVYYQNKFIGLGISDSNSMLKPYKYF